MSATMRSIVLSAWLAAALLPAALGCGEPSAPREIQAKAPADRAPPPRAAKPEPAADARLRDDRGGWDPSPDLIDFAARLSDGASKADALTELAALPLARRIDILRAGLRLLDDTAARACAARLTWKWIDGWECARCVDLLIGDVLRPGTEADFHELRSYLGSVDVARLFAEAPPLPWAEDPEQVAGQMHRLIRAEHAALFLMPDARLPEACRETLASEYFATAFDRSDANREIAQEYWTGEDGDASQASPGLPPLVRGWWRDAMAWTWELDEEPWRPDLWDLRWMYASTLSGEDSAMLCDALERLHPRADSRETAIRLLGKVRDDRSAAVLRKLILDDDTFAWSAKLALARRGEDALLDWATAEAPEDSDCLATLMEAAPDRARRLLDATLLGTDEVAADRLLTTLEDFAQPGAIELPAGHPDWRRTSFAGFESAAAAKPMSALRLGRIALVVPGCRTRSLATVVCERLTVADLDPEAHGDDDPRADADLAAIGAFLETAAPDALRVALRRIAAGTGDGRGVAIYWLTEIGDPESAELLVAEFATAGQSVESLARTHSPVVRAELERRVKAARVSGDENELGRAVGALAVFHGIPDDSTYFLFDDVSAEQVDAVLAGRPVDAVMSALSALMDPSGAGGVREESPRLAGRLSGVQDPRVRDWLQEVRRRRDLESYWWATGELAAMGDPAARAEYWRAMTDGRYRILDDAGDTPGRTLGWDLAATLPHWISELETNCCRANVAESVLEETIGFRYGGTARTDVSRAREIWDAAGGRFVRSRIAGYWVPAPR